ncbi:hypothetical protein [Nocardia uniformis]|uniref:hypothetical protein n=1 Tax=Nocardia uniformis TaxID=53432 RepID=UPI000A7B08C4|nr:hypothetical protein [Nocardia uniformis]
MTERKRTRLEWPRAWGAERPPLIVFVALAFFTICGVGLIVLYANTHFQQGRALQGMFGVVTGLSALMVAVGLVPALRVRREKLPSRIRVTTLSDGSVGLRIGVRPQWKPLMVTCLSLFAGMFLLRAILSALNASSASDPVMSGLNVLGVVISIFVVAAVTYTLAYMFFGRRPYFLAITETKVVHAAGKSTSALHWDEIDKIEPVLYANTHMVRVTSARRVGIDVTTYDDRHRLTSAIDVIPVRLDIDPPLLLALLRFYSRYPELRNELTSDAVVDRMRRADFRTPKTLRRDNSQDKSSDQSPRRFRSARGLDTSAVTDS